MHNTTSKASEKFTEVVGFDVEDFLVDIYYWFDKSTKLQVQLESFCNFCDQDFKKVIKHVSTQWLGLESCVTRTLGLFQALRFYFLSEENPSPRFQRLVSKLTNQMREVYLFFLSKCISIIYQFQLIFTTRRSIDFKVVFCQYSVSFNDLAANFINLM